MHRFLEVLAEGPLLFDGAIGTEFYRRGVYLTNNFEELNLTQPHLVRSVHEEYVKSGAQVITTNSYGANRLRLRRFGLEEKCHEINAAAARLAREAAGEAVWVAGSVGPSGAEGARIMGPHASEVRDAFAEQVGALVEGGVDVILTETFTHLVEVRLVIEIMNELHADVPVVASMRFEPDRRLADGSEPEEVAAALADWGADVLGANCGEGPELVFNVARRMLGAGPPVLAEPNAGSPEMVEGRSVYVGNPEFFGVYGRRMLKAGIRAVGGCCGTTPNHIHSMRGAVRMMSGGTGWKRVDTAQVRVAESDPVDRSRRVPIERRSRLAQKMAAGEFVVSVEVNPPAGLDPAPAVAAATMLTDAGVDVINTADGPRASVRMNNLAAAIAMQEAGAEVLLHICCRDRNLLALQGDILGAHALGIRNLVVITGDPPKVGDYPDATAVYDLDSIELLRWIDGFNHGVDPTGKRLEETTNFHVATGVEPGALDYDRELRRLERKVAAGADFVMTQPVFDPLVMERFLDDIKELDVPILLGLLPFASARNAEFLHENVPGMTVPQDVRDRMAAAGSGDRVQGAYIMPPLGRYEMAVQILDGFER
jgi:homocysteine S-methyltransferase